MMDDYDFVPTLKKIASKSKAKDESDDDEVNKFQP